MFLLNNIWKIHFLNIRLIKRYFYHSITENRALNEYKAVFVSKFLFNILINPGAECRIFHKEKAKHKGFANYKVYITRQGTARKLNYTYKVVPGKSNQTIAIDILEEMGYDTKLLDKAREIIEHPEKYQAKF